MEDKRIKILAIDDNPDNLISLDALIQETFFTAEVLMATDGQRGLDLARQEDPDVILLDILMPVMDGFEVCRRLKSDSFLRDIPVVFVTAMRGDPLSRVTALECGAEAFLSKPIDVSELTAQIRAMLKIKYWNAQKRSEKERLSRLIEEKTESLEKEILERRQIEEDLRTSEEKYRLLAENISDVIWILNLTQRKLTYMSPSVQHLRGLSVEEALAEKLTDALAPDSLENMRKLMEEYSNEFMSAPNSSRYHTFEIQQPCKNGGAVWTEVSASFRLNKSGDIEIVGVSRNIEERKKSEKLLIEAKNKAVDANIVKSQFLANMSHELRTPLNGVLGSLQLLGMTSLSEDQKELIDISEQSSVVLLEIIDDILNFSKIEAGQIKLEVVTFQLVEFLSSIEKMFMPAALNNRLNLTATIGASVPQSVKGDPLRLKQVLSNLIGNAIKFTHSGGVTVSVRALETFQETVRLEWRVEDTGIGIDEEVLGSIFKSFTQADNSVTRKYGGTGLGLSISKALVELMGGEIGVESVKGAGSCFFFTCVMETGKESEHPSVEEILELELWEQLDGLKLLVVEDDETSRFVIQHYGTKMDWHMLFVENGLEAAQAYEKRMFDVVLMDIQMKGCDGFRAAQMIRELEKQSGRHTPIIAMTARTLKDCREMCMAAGMEGYLSKPLNLLELQETVERMVKMKRERK